MTDELRRRHRTYLGSRQWKDTRERVVYRSNLSCERCGAVFGTARGLDVHHKTYERVGCEHDDDLEVLCATCHRQADGERATDAQARSARALYNARFHGWLASKGFAFDHADDESMYDEFDAFVERQDSRDDCDW